MRWGYCASAALALALVATTLGGGSSAFAAFTTVNAPIFPEDGRQQILNHVYGGTFTSLADGVSYTNGSITATRVEDIFQPTDPGISPALLVDTNGPIGDDQLWHGDFTLASAEAVWGRYHQEFGYIDGDHDGTYVKLFDVTNDKYAVTGSADDLSSLSDHVLRWARGGENGVLSSKISDNSDQRDHMITFAINGLDDGKLTWLLMFEDKRAGQDYADFDYNDLVVQLKAIPTAETPEPATAAIVSLMSLGLISVRRRRNQRPSR